ncbi:MAG: heme-binding domain-containing protein [Deltaproteobacteria bacterium]|nr:heme-binding domain-containing protein [Deltaproteobacteria bacterium]
MALMALPVVLVLMVVGAGSKTNPKVERTIEWNSPETKALFDRACLDCHSHETKWPWYANVAPVSWMVIHNVDEARDEFNISGKDLGEADEAAEKLAKGIMPPKGYLVLHSEAKLNEAERKQLIEGLKATFGEEHDDDEPSEDKKEAH